MRRRMTLELDSNNHSVFSLNYHLILVIKYRKKVFTSQKMLDRLKEIATYIGDSHNVKIKEMNGEPDHVHFLLRTKPNCDLSKYINAIKSASSRLLKKEFPEVKKKLWKEAFWTTSYCLITVGGAPITVLKKYIESQSGVEHS
jgi:putative transposase